MTEYVRTDAGIVEIITTTGASGGIPIPGGVSLVPKLVTSPYTLLESDNGRYIVFDEADAVVNVPDAIAVGTYFHVANIGSGIVTCVLIGTHTSRGGMTPVNSDGMMTMYKLTGSVWQTTEVAVIGIGELYEDIELFDVQELFGTESTTTTTITIGELFDGVELYNTIEVHA